jgi:hypothetical protein
MKKITTNTVLNVQRVTKTLTKALREQAPNMSSYVNEAIVDEPSYQQVFWGNPYDR